MNKRDILLAGQVFTAVLGAVGILYFTLCYNDYEENGKTRIVESKHKGGYSTYEPQYALENFLGIKRYKEITFNFREDPCSLGFPRSTRPAPKSLECAKKRIDLYLEKQKEFQDLEIVGTKYIKYP